MQKISPLRSSLEAFRKFKANRENVKTNQVHTNPFGITFKGTVLQMDVFESAKSSAPNIVKQKMQEAGKLAASAWTTTINKFSSIKKNIIDFAQNIKTNTKEFIHMLNTTNVEFNFSKYNVKNLAKRPISELGEMFSKEISMLKVVK